MTAAWLNGAPDTQALATHRGLHYGDGVFRTCLVHAGAVVALEGQLDKLLHDAARLELETDRGALRREAAAAGSTLDRGVLKILLLRAGGERGYRSRESRADRLMCTYLLPHYPDASRGVRAARAHFRLSPQTTLAGIKHLNRLEQVLASRRFPDGVEEVVLEDDAGAPVCGTRTNLFWVKDGALCTPPVDRCGVAGFTRERILAQGGQVRATSFAELANADELFLCNSLVGIWPVKALDGREWAAPGPLTRRAIAQLRHPGLA